VLGELVAELVAVDRRDPLVDGQAAPHERDRYGEHRTDQDEPTTEPERAGGASHASSVGSRTTNRAPPPCRSSTHASPPSAAACSATSANPSPVPIRLRAALPRANRSKIRVRSLAATPGPSSSTTSCTDRLTWDGSIAIRVGPPAWLAALSSRL